MPAGGWVFGRFSPSRQGVSVGFRLVGGVFGRKSTGGEWSACLWAKLMRAWLWGRSGAGLADRWLVYRRCIRDGLLRSVAPDRRVGSRGSYVGTLTLCSSEQIFS